jgi:hypothetical protein
MNWTVSLFVLVLRRFGDIMRDLCFEIVEYNLLSTVYQSLDSSAFGFLASSIALLTRLGEKRLLRGKRDKLRSIPN